MKINKTEPLEYTQAETISLKSHPQFNEAWLHRIIKEDPSILGLGDIIIRHHEKVQSKAGRLDFVMQDLDLKKLYEIEIQLGSTDESHIIRTIEYWDIERKRYPDYSHCAVIIAEEITSRFFNVISLFNGKIPLIAIQVKAIKIGNQITLDFTRVLNEIDFDRIDDLPQANELTRGDWESKSTPENVKVADTILEYIGTFADGYKLKYNKIYIGLIQGNKAQNFVLFRPQKDIFRLDLKCKIPDEFRAELEKDGLKVRDFASNFQVQPIELTQEEVASKKEAIIKALKYAYTHRFGPWP